MFIKKVQYKKSCPKYFMMLESTFPIDDLQYYRRSLRSSGPYYPLDTYIVIELFYKSTLLDYVFQTKHRSGPSGEKYIVANEKSGLDDSRLPEYISEAQWKWCASLDEAADFILTREFVHNL